MRCQTDSDFAQYTYRDDTRVDVSGGCEPNEASILQLALTDEAAPQGESPERRRPGAGPAAAADPRADPDGFGQRAPMGSKIKVMAIYSSAWWRYVWISQ